MRYIELPGEPLDNIWLIFPGIDESIKFWYGEGERRGRFSLYDEDWTSIYLVDEGRGMLYLPENNKAEFEKSSALVVNEEHEITTDYMKMRALRVAKPKFKDFSSAHFTNVGGEWPIAFTMGGIPIQMVYAEFYEVDSKKADAPHLYKETQEGYFTRSGLARLRVSRCNSTEDIELVPNTLVLVDPLEAHAIVEIKEPKPHKVTLFNYKVFGEETDKVELGPDFRKKP